MNWNGNPSDISPSLTFGMATTRFSFYVTVRREGVWCKEERNEDLRPQKELGVEGKQELREAVQVPPRHTHSHLVSWAPLCWGPLSVTSSVGS